MTLKHTAIKTANKVYDQRFVFWLAVVGLLVAILLIWGNMARNKAMLAYRATQVTKVAKVAPATDSIKQVIEESEPVPVIAPNFTTKTVRCELNGGRCWDPKTGRYVDLGKSR